MARSGGLGVGYDLAGRGFVGRGDQHANTQDLQLRVLSAGIVGRNGGFTREVATECIVIPALAPERITPHTEGLCAVLWHLLVSHPLLQRAATKWESVSPATESLR